MSDTETDPTIYGNLEYSSVPKRPIPLTTGSFFRGFYTNKRGLALLKLILYANHPDYSPPKNASILSTLDKARPYLVRPPSNFSPPYSLFLARVG